MANIKRIGQGLGVVIVAGVVVAGGWAWTRLNTGRASVADDSVTLAEVTGADAEAVKRGEYVMRSGDCVACHTGKGEEFAGDFAGGYQIHTPFGTLVASNITPDTETGIGGWTERDFFKALRHGQGKGDMLYPAMPYTAYAKLTDADMHDLWAYMSTIEPVKNAVDENGGMAFPYNIRLAMAGWDMLFFDNSAFEPVPGQSDEWNRGKYLVDGAGHCSACHTPRNGLGAEVAAHYMQGAVVDGWFAPELTSNPHVGLGEVGAESVAQYLKTGSDGTAFAAGPMAEAVEHSTQYLTDADAKAIATYLVSLPGSDAVRPAPMSADTAAMRSAALAYEVNCSACHGVSGEGIGSLAPAFAGNHAIQSDNVTSIAGAVLRGARAAHTDTLPTAGGMPAFGWKFDDVQIASVLDYIRNSWGNAASPVSPEDVAKFRTATGALPKLAPPAE
ncbi:cytochrome c [Frigidibacter sp. MR17.14]|uniref:cytochrome c n=1 Tax=Frigidibacter sp. MR17.14 TaxID=3126509 RepID=UPI003012E4F8